MTRVSVVLPTFDRLPRLRLVLEGLARQSVDPADLEVVVVSDGSTDGTDAWLASGRTPLPVVAAFQPTQGPAAARNRGVELATGDLVLFLDDDVVPLPGLVRAHLDAHARAGADVVVLGPMLDPPGVALAPWVRYEQAMLAKQYAAMAAGQWEPTARQFYTGNASLRRTHVLDAGGFDPAFTRAEDVELAYRLAARGLRFLFVPDAAGHHHADRRFTSWRATAYQYGRNDVVFTRDKGQEWLGWAISREFGHHHRLVQLLVRGCVGRPLRQRLAVGGFTRLATAAEAFGAERVAMAALSAVYNATYYQGVADELGSVPGNGPLTSLFPTAPSTS